MTTRRGVLAFVLAAVLLGLVVLVVALNLRRPAAARLSAPVIGWTSRACVVAWMPRANGPECGTKLSSALRPVSARAIATTSGVWRWPSAP